MEDAGPTTCGGAYGRGTMGRWPTSASAGVINSSSHSPHHRVQPSLVSYCFREPRTTTNVWTVYFSLTPPPGSAFTRLLLFRGASHHHQCLDRILLLGHLTACVHLTFIFFNFYFNFFPRMSGLRLLRIGAGHADAVIFGRPFIGNPDLPARLTNGWELAESDASLWYSASEAGPWGSTHSPPHSQEVPLLTPSSISSLSPPIVGSRMSRVHLCEALIGRANTYTDVIGRHTRM